MGKTFGLNAVDWEQYPISRPGCGSKTQEPGIAERLTAEFGQIHEGVYLSVRFGNVLASRGSMLETRP